MEIVLWTFVLGLVSAMVMAGFLVVIEKFGPVHSDDYWIFGKLFFLETRKAKILGLFSHILAGVFFAFLYIWGWSLFEIDPGYYPLLGLATGFVHGVAVGISQIILLTNVENGLNVGLVYVVSHVIFGLILGVGVNMADQQIHYTHDIARFLKIEGSKDF